MANRLFWQTVRHLRGKRSQTAFFIEDSNGVFLKDQDAILNKLREYFSDFLNQGVEPNPKLNREPVKTAFFGEPEQNLNRLNLRSLNLNRT